MIEGTRLVVHTPGGPDAIVQEACTFPAPGPGELLIANEAVGLNFIDVYYRTGLYPAALPHPLGAESAGRVIAVGPGTPGFAQGDRVGCAQGSGAYASHRLIEARHAVLLPDAISAEVAAAAMLKGFTASYLAEDIVRLRKGDAALVHAAAGGVGSLLVPWLRDKGVIVVAHVGSAEKAAGITADHVVTGSFEALAQGLLEATGGRKADVVYDGVGKASWTASLDCLRPRGMMVSYGNASGAVPPVVLTDLMRAGSLVVTRPTLGDFIATPDDLARTAGNLFGRIAASVVTPVIGQRFALSEAAEAHRMLEARQTHGSTILIP
jgi:NADPH2:quinone reductase